MPYADPVLNREYHREYKARKRDEVRGHVSRLRRYTLRDMSEPEAAWVGAFIDAEGTVLQHHGRWLVSVVNTDVEHISALLRATGVGTVCYKAPNIGTKDLFVWQVHQDRPLRELAQRLAPYSLKLQRVAA